MVLTGEHGPAAGFTPCPDQAEVAIPAPGAGPGYWAGGPSAALGGDGVIYLAYRLRRPVGAGRGYAVAVASSADGVSFETVAMITRERMGAESLERPSLVRVPGGGWRLYLSCATPGTKHWRIELAEAAHPAGLGSAASTVVLPGDAATGVKDPVIRYHGGQWEMWAALHPLAEWDEADQMVTGYATSPDGREWTSHGTALGRRPGAWDARGARVSAVLGDGAGLAAFYDGRASAAENCEERTGVATGPAPAALAAVGGAPVAEAPGGLRGLRYLDILPLGNGQHRLYYELTRPDGAHDLVTELRG